MDKELLQKLKKKLVYGDITKIAKEAKVSISTVSFWLKGKEFIGKEERIIEAIKIVISRRKEKFAKNENEVKSLISN